MACVSFFVRQWIRLNSLNRSGHLPMEKRVDSSLFVNDGSFMDKFKQLQQEKEKGNNGVLEESTTGKILPGSSTPKIIISKTNINVKKTVPASSSGKLAFSLKQKSKPVAPAVKLGEDEEDEETNDNNMSGVGSIKRPKLGQPDSCEQSSQTANFAPPSPSDPAVKKVADKLASFVAKNGRQFEHVTRQRNPGDTPFKFLFDEGCEDYKYYEYRLIDEERAISQLKECQTPHSSGINTSSSVSLGSSQRSSQQHANYQIPASALYESFDDARASATPGAAGYGESSAPSGTDPITMMEFYMKKAAQEEKKKQPKKSKDEMPPPASLQGAGGKGHHMGDYIPPDELEKFLASCNDAAAQKAAKDSCERAKIQADNVGHRLLSKMGWREGEGLGGSRKGISDPIMAGDVKKNHLGVGAHNPGEVTPEDDIYEQYKKRMMLGYKHRPNPLNNPRKSYY